MVISLPEGRNLGAVFRAKQVRPPGQARDVSVSAAPYEAGAARRAFDFGQRVRLTSAVAALFTIGLALRLWCARGPLWVDEIWSIENLEPLAHWWGVLCGISHDNNHFLNSLWLFFAYPASADPVWLRALSILAGSLAIPAMARLGARRNAPAAVAAAALMAFSFYFVSYSVEARGYASAALALILAYDALERWLDEPTGRARYAFAAAAGAAFFCHLASAVAILLFGVIAVGETFRRGGDARAAAAAGWRLAWPTAIALAPTFAFLVAGYVITGGFAIGHVEPFAALHTIGGFTRMAALTLGLPTTLPVFAILTVAAPLAVAAALVFGLIAPERRIACGVLFFAPAIGALILRVPNSHIPRYYLPSAIALILVVAEIAGEAWRRGGAARLVGAGAILAMLAGDVAALMEFQAAKASAWPDALAAIRASGETRLASNFDFGVGKQVAYFDRNEGAKLEMTPQARLCGEKPGWYVVEREDRIFAPEVELGAPDCRLAYRFTRAFGESGLSQTPWGLYRRVEAAP